MTRLSGPVKSARRALEILECFEASKRPMGVQELAVKLGYPLSSTSRLIETLATIGYLNFDSGSRKFAPTLRVSLLGDWIVAADPGLSRVKPLVQDARRLTGATAVLCTLNGIDTQYIHVIRAEQRSFRSRGPAMGTRRPLLRGAPGLMLLSGLDDARIALITRRINATRGERNDLSRLMAEVGRIRKAGYAWDAGSVYEDVGAVAIRLPIDDVFGKPLVLAVAGAASWFEAEHHRLAGVLRRLVGRYRRYLTPDRNAAPAG